MIAIVESYRLGLLKFQNWRRNIIAGIVVAVVALPLSMAFAIATGVKPEQGLYTAIIAGLIVAIFGGTRTQISGPTGAFVVILAAIVAKHGVVGLQVATVMGGVILCIMGILKFGNAIKIIPYPVVVGFTSGIAVTIFIGQWKSFFGLPITIPADYPFYKKFVSLVLAIPSLGCKTTLLSILSLGILVFSPRYLKRVPAVLVAMVFVTLLQYFFQFEGVATIGSVFGDIPRTLPSFKLPSFAQLNIADLVGPAFTIALLGAIESLLAATAIDGMSGTKHNANQELIGQGMANIVAPFFNGFASTGAMARNVVSVRHGANSSVAAIIQSLTLVLILLFLAPYAAHIPLAVLAAILFVVAYNMSDVPEFIHIVRHAPWHDTLVLLTTFFLTVFTDLVIGVAVGVIMAILLFMVKFNQSVSVSRKKLGLVTKINLGKKLNELLASKGIVYAIEGPLFFGVAEKIEHALGDTHTDPKFIVLRFINVPFIDMTGLETLSKVIEQYRKRQVKVYICEVNKKILEKLTSVGIIKMLEGSKIFESVDHVVRHYSKNMSETPA